MIGNPTKSARLRAAACLVMFGLAGCVRLDHDAAPGTAVHDAALSRRVAGALRNDRAYKFDDVRVNIYRTSAQLGGFVDTPQHRERAEEVAAQVPGVETVINKITLKDETNAPEEPPPATTASALQR